MNASFAHPGSPLRIILADDSDVIRDQLRTLLLAHPGLAVVGEASHAIEAIRLVRRLQPDVLILDISMPGGSGMFVLESVKHDQPRIRVFMLTNFDYPPYRDKCRELGAEAFLDKATEFNTILDALLGPPSSLSQVA